MKKLSIILLGMLTMLPTFARSFKYEYEGQELSYDIISEEDNIVSVGYENNVSGDVIIPAIVKVGDTEYSVTSIGAYAFFSCSGITTVEIPNSITSIGVDAFSYCNGLTSVVIPNSVTSIGSMAFNQCRALTSVSIGDGVKLIGHNAFRGCKSMTSLTIGDSVEIIGDYAFCSCSGLTSVKIPNSVTSIGASAFFDCFGLTSLIIGDAVETIGNASFYSCSSLTSVGIPNSVISIGDHAFSYCSGLNSIAIPNSVTSMGKYAFSNCTSMSSVTLPKSIISIGEKAFTGCGAIEKVIYKAESPVAASQDLFERSVYDTATLCVPVGSVNSYQETEPWSYFHFIVDNYVSVDAENVLLNTDTLTLKVGDTATLTAVVLPDDAEDATLIWTSSNEEVATVDHNGVVTAWMEGKAIITASSSVAGVDAKCEVTVLPPTGVESISGEAKLRCDIYNLQGVCLKRNASVDDVKALAPGLYIIAGKKVLVK